MSYTGMQFTIRTELFPEEFHVRCNTKDGAISITHHDEAGEDTSITLMYDEAAQLVRILQHAIAMHGEPT